MAQRSKRKKKASKRRGAVRHVVITGAGTGIGRAIALRLAANGSRLTLLGRRRAPLKKTVEACLAAGAKEAIARTADISDSGAVKRAFAAAVRAHGPVHCLVANAGVGGPNTPGEGDRFDELVATNLTGTYLTLRAAEANLADGPELRHMVVVSSILARIGVPGYTGYCASKAGLLGLVRSLAMELAEKHVQVNAICPGWVDTDMAWEGIEGMAAGMGVSRDEAFATAMGDVPAGRMSKPEEIAGMVAWLCSPDARGVTGQAVDMNGGAWMG